MNCNLSLEKRLLVRARRFLFLALGLAVCGAISGCASNGVSVLAWQSSRTPIKPSEVKVYPNFKNLSAPWQVEGMVSANILPLLSNTPANREEVMRNTAADLGVNMLVGVQSSLNGDGLLDHSNAILAKTGVINEANRQVPKFIVFLPAVNFKIDKDPSIDKLDGYIREHIRYFLTYAKGYYVYGNDLLGMASAGILQGNIDPATFIEPLGIIPDYALLCDVTGYDESGNIVTSRTRSLRLTLTLFDVKERRIAWSSETLGTSKQSYLGSVFMIDGGLLGGLAKMQTRKEETLSIVRKAVRDATDSLPVVDGFQAGPLNFMRGQLNEK